MCAAAFADCSIVRSADRNEEHPVRTAAMDPTATTATKAFTSRISTPVNDLASSEPRRPPRFCPRKIGGLPPLKAVLILGNFDLH